MYASPLPSIPLVRTGKYGLRAEGAGGTKAGSNHEGVDARAAVGTQVRATIGGTVVQTITGWRSATSPGVSRGRAIFRPGMGGNQVVLRGDDGRDHNDGHLSSVLVKVGQRVETGDLLATSGRTGVVEAHLHHGIWLEYMPNRWRSIDPTPLLPWDGDKFGELDRIKASNPLPTTPTPEDSMANYTDDHAKALDWLAPEERRKLIDQAIYHTLPGLAARFGLLDEVGRDVDSLEWLADREGQADLIAYQMGDLHARVGVLDRLGLLGEDAVDLSPEDVAELAGLLAEALPKANGQALVEALAQQLSLPTPE